MPTGSHPLAGQERLWEPLLPALRERLPLLTFGPYEPNQRAGPASWLRCMIALTLPDDVLPAHAVPVIYLGVVRRADIRAIEDCPKTVQRLAELQREKSEADTDEWIERVARDELRLVKPNEVIYDFSKKPGASSEAADQPPGERSPQ